MENYTFKDEIAAMQLVAEVAGIPIIRNDDGLPTFEGVTPIQSRALFYIAERFALNGDATPVEIRAVCEYGNEVGSLRNADPADTITECLFRRNM